MTPLRYLPSFRGDLEQIWLYIAQDNMAAADRLIDDLCERCQVLSEHPKAGSRRPDIAPDCRQLVIDRYVILYRIREEQIELIRALHGRRRQTDSLVDEDR